MDEDNFNPDIISRDVCSIRLLTLPNLDKSFSAQGNKPFISLPKGKGIKLSIAEERDKRLGIKA